MSAAKLRHSYNTNPPISALLPLIVILYGYGEARERGVDCKADRLWARRRLQGGQSVGAASAAKLEKRVDVTNYSRRFATAMGKLVSAVSTARRTERGRSAGRKADRAWAQRRLQGGQSESAASAAKVEKRVDVTSAVAGISYGYGEARERSVDCKADSSWAQRRLQGGQFVGAASAAKVEKRVDATSAVAGIISYGYGQALTYGYGEARERSVDCKADRAWAQRRLQGGQSESAASAAKVEKRVDATSAVAGTHHIKATRIAAFNIASSTFKDLYHAGAVVVHLN
ncbi:hypothetical protein GN958_ATG06486 [Phytophthora infestans]|uniref:Uncharacterized protein n=1 Tax=Phytophthora infestans TaxID=4787 RepID=A0A8S9UVA6_PHYIN|nr:hypothetical protein GN958_ATG06486 [Phytophthora infestans]